MIPLWITDGEFADLRPVDLLGKEHAKKNLPDTEHTNRHILFRKTFDAEEGGEYILKISADDIYKLYINGKFVMTGPAPCYPFAQYYNEADVGRYLRPGKNEIMVHVYYQGLCNRVYFSGDLRAGLWLALYRDKEPVCVSDGSWECAKDNRFSGTPVGYDTQFLENIDFTKENPGFVPASLVRYDDHIMIKQPCPTCVYEERAPHSIRSAGDGSFLLDFGKERAGVLFIPGLPENSGAIDIFYAEELTAEGRAMSDMRCMSGVRERWILDCGRDAEGFEYKAFRYAEIRGRIDPYSVRMLCRHYPYGENRSFHSENRLLDGILQICRQAVTVSTQDTFMDCPTREKGQYLGDLAVTAPAHFHITGDGRLYKKALLDFAASSAVCPGLLSCAPCSYMQEIADYSLLFPYIVWNYHRLTGDLETLEAVYPSIAEGLLAYFARFERKDRLLCDVTEKWNLVDWPDGMRDSYAFSLTNPTGKGCHNVINAYYYGALKYTALISKILGKSDDFGAEEVLESFNRSFFDPLRGLYTDIPGGEHCSLHSNALVLFFGMAKEQDAICDLIEKKGLCCGVFFSYFVLKGLIFAGRREQALSLIMNEGENSWYNMLKEGASAVFEAWGKEKKWNTSLCHPWAAAPLIIIAEDFPELLSDGDKNGKTL